MDEQMGRTDTQMNRLAQRSTDTLTDSQTMDERMGRMDTQMNRLAYRSTDTLTDRCQDYSMSPSTCCQHRNNNFNTQENATEQLSK